MDQKKEDTDIIKWFSERHLQKNPERLEFSKVLLKRVKIEDASTRIALSNQYITENTPTLRSFLQFLITFERYFEQIKKENLNTQIQSNIDKEKKILLSLPNRDQYNWQQIIGNLNTIKTKIEYLIKYSEIIDGKLKISESMISLLHFIFFAIEYLDEGINSLSRIQNIDKKYPLPQIFEINISSITARGKHKKRRPTKRRRSTKRRRPTKRRRSTKRRK
tara:strand:- start:2435 stop:3094 length:660 start_codon:yes stop_codon:yes gene_type:complete